MIDLLNELLNQKLIREIDHQLGQITYQSWGKDLPKEQRELASVISTAISNEYSRGHICMSVRSRLFGAPSKKIESILDVLPPREDWGRILSECPLFDSTKASPFVFEDNMVYLRRYWKYEKKVAERIISLAQPIEMKKDEYQSLNALLDKLFPRPYKFLYDRLQLPNKNLRIEGVKVATSDVLDIRIEDAPFVDWDDVYKCLTNAQCLDDVKNGLDSIIPDKYLLNWQKVAAATALTRKFAVISGGPGTGKTTTVTKLLAAIVEQAVGQNEKAPDIKLVAPTGKAAARLTESISSAISSLDVSEQIKDLIPSEAATIHRLLGARRNRETYIHGAKNPLHLDIIVVDEASMVDLPLMVSLLVALPNEARIILLGDKDQLASVEAGAVLGDICSFSKYDYSKTHSTALNVITGSKVPPAPENQKPPAIVDSLCVLKKSYRFHAKSGIGQLASAINSGLPEQVDKVLEQGFNDIELNSLSTDSYNELIKQCCEHYTDYLTKIRDGATPREVLHAFNKTRLLCSNREGEFGIYTMNNRIQRLLQRKRLVNPTSTSSWFIGRPVIVTQNDHSMGLYNGDVGVAMNDPDTGEINVFFELPDGTVRGFLPSRVPSHETVFAMTIHKSQGSEFNNTFMVLPIKYNPLLTRELVYTGVTRAKERLKLFATEEILKTSIQSRTERKSGLVRLLG
ncbi:exodeoxyribonuclease V subunit alpha [Vibrio alginolyticus]|uniref:exodeoxyribonuclease V subunit alpha n=1 Tax=Vibrio alginolyticus TaxID=663 RepID=UPI0006CA9ED0|nr:exodeoxyribonuclease V subunit alpha [Vibrio alginolyticus]KPM97480.1 hypothetical protein AOG25_13490 [Vibrio alginolyticus]